MHSLRVAVMKTLTDRFFELLTGWLGVRQFGLSLALTLATAFVFYASPSTEALNLVEYGVVLVFWLLVTAAGSAAWTAALRWIRQHQWWR